MDVAQSSLDNNVKDFFEHGSFKKFFNEVSHNILDGSNSLVLIIGPEGSGKTTLMQDLKNSLQAEINFSEIKANADESVNQMTQNILAGFKNKKENKSRWVLMLDDAQNLLNTQLKALLQLNILQDQMPKKMVTVLLGNAALSQRIANILDEKDVVINFKHFRMPLLEQSQLYAFCQNVLSNCNVNADKILTDDNLERIWNYSKGSPFMLEKALLATIQQHDAKNNSVNNQDEHVDNKDKVNMNLLSVFVGGFLLFFTYQIFTSNMYIPFGLLSFIN